MGTAERMGRGQLRGRGEDTRGHGMRTPVGSPGPGRSRRAPFRFRSGAAGRARRRGSAAVGPGRAFPGRRGPAAGECGAASPRPQPAAGRPPGGPWRTPGGRGWASTPR